MRQPVSGRTIPALFVLFLLAPLSKQVSKPHPAPATTTHQTAPDQQADQPAIVAATLLLAVLILVVIVVPLMPLLQQLCDQQAPQAAPAGDAAPDQQAGEAMVVATAFVAVLIFFLVFVVICPCRSWSILRAASGAGGVGGRCCPRSQASEAMVFTTAFVTVLVFPLLSFPQQVRQQQSTYAAAAQHAAADQQLHDVLLVPAASFRANLISISQQRVGRHGILLLLKLSAGPARGGPDWGSFTATSDFCCAGAPSASEACGALTCCSAVARIA